MKKLAKVLLAFILIIGVGFTGFTIGKNTGSSLGSLSKEDQEHILELDAMKKLIGENYLFDYDESTLYEGSLKGMFVNLGDPYTQYYTKDEFSKLLESINGEYAGIGVVVQASKEDGYIKAVQVFDDSPAKKAGVKVGDLITKVDGVEYSADKMEDAVNHIKGKAGTEVKLTILRTNKKKEQKEIELTVKRANITEQTVTSKIVEKDGHKLGYLQLKQFEDVSYDDFTKNLKSLENKGAEGLILDLRNNPGGSLEVCLKIADIFLDEGVIVSTVDKNDKEIVEQSDAEMDDIPMVVLVNENSASASEILSGALKDRKRATIIGKTTFGKGIVQKIFPLSNGSGAKITVSEYFTPNKTKIHGVGVKPDIEVDSNSEDDSALIDINKLDSDAQYKQGLKTILEKIEK